MSTPHSRNIACVGRGGVAFNSVSIGIEPCSAQHVCRQSPTRNVAQRPHRWSASWPGPSSHMMTGNGLAFLGVPALGKAPETEHSNTIATSDLVHFRRYRRSRSTGSALQQDKVWLQLRGLKAGSAQASFVTLYNLSSTQEVTQQTAIHPLKRL
eukprot:EG_transcript_22898